MCFPLMNKRPRQAVVVPELSGGMNLRDSVSMVLDNQLTDARNVWFKDGVLKTRPGIDNMAHFINENWRDAEIKPHEIFNTVEGEVCRLFTAQSDTHIYFFWIGKYNKDTKENNFIELPAIRITCKNFFVVQKDKNLYCFLQSGTVYKCDISADEPKWEPLGEGENDFYVPTIATNCMAANIEGSITNAQLLKDATMLEGFNLLGNRFKIYASTVDKEELSVGAEGEPKKHYMMYAIPFAGDVRVEHLLETILKVSITQHDGQIAEHTVEVTEAGTFEESSYNKIDGLKLEARIQGGESLKLNFYRKDSDFPTYVTEDDYIFNNMEIIAPCYNPPENYDKIFNMSCATWFGGAAEGVYGGTRLFLGGNETEPNLVCYSDLNNPLYFPENNYFYVGESTSPVTAFGKMSDMLVIFKDNETYYTQYQRNTGITAKAVMNQSVIDIAASSVYFPLTLINANIGCDCPDTVELCRNRLVWTNSEGKVYTLVSSNQYNERNIFEIGEMIHRKLKTEKNLKNARSIDWNGYYLLHTKDTEDTEASRIYVLDYNSYGYQYVSSYSKTEDANLRIPWYFWEFELKAGNLQSTALDVVDGALLLVESGYYGIFKAEFNEEAAYDYLIDSTDTSLEEYRTIPHPIKSEAQTKLFEFGAQGYYKNVDKVVLSVGNNGGVPINVSFVTDMGAEETEILPDGSQTEAYTAGYVKSMQLSPCVRQVERFGLKLSCEGPLAVDGITLTYRVTGGAR